MQIYPNDCDNNNAKEFWNSPSRKINTSDHSFPLGYVSFLKRTTLLDISHSQLSNKFISYQYTCIYILKQWHIESNSLNPSEEKIPKGSMPLTLNYAAFQQTASFELNP